MYKIYSISNKEEKGIFINLRNLEVNYLGELLYFDKYLDKIKEYNKIILINVIPIDNISSDIVNINIENSEYIEKIYNTIKKYPKLNIQFCTSSIRILNILKEKFIHNTCGYYISDDLNYPNTNIYVFPYEKYNYKKISRELNHNKIIYIILSDKNDFQKEKVLSITNDYNLFLIEKE